MPQEFQVLQCYKCETFQVHQVKKALKWICKLCGEKQSIKKVYGRGSGIDCRKHVQQLNTKRGELYSLREDSLPTVDSYNDNSIHDNSYHNYSEDLPDNERYTTPGTSKWSQYSEVSEELGTSISDGEDDPQVTTDRNYFKSKNKSVKRKEKETTNHPSKYPKWEATSCLDQTDTSQSGQLMFGSSVKLETKNYSQHARMSQYPATFTTRTDVQNIPQLFPVFFTVNSEENRKQLGNNTIPSDKTLDQDDVDTSSKWGSDVKNKMNYIYENENEESAGTYVLEEDYMSEDQGTPKTYKTDYKPKINDETVYTSYKGPSSKWRRYAHDEPDPLSQEVKETTTLDKTCNNTNILRVSRAVCKDKGLKTVNENNEIGNYLLQEHSRLYFAVGVDRSRNVRKYIMTDRQKPKEFDSDPVKPFHDANNESQKENLEEFKTDTSKRVCNSGSKWSKFMVEFHSHSAADDNDNNDDNFVNEDIKHIIGQPDDSGEVIGQAYNSEIVTAQASDAEVVVGQAYDFEGITGQAYESGVITRQAYDSRVITGQAYDSEVVVGQTYDSGGITGQACDSEVIIRQACDSVVITGQANDSGDTVSRNMGLTCKDFTHKEMSKTNIHVVDKIHGFDKTVSDDKNRIAASESMPLQQLNIDGCSGPVHLERGYVVKNNNTDQKYVTEKLSIFSAGELADEDLDFNILY